MSRDDKPAAAPAEEAAENVERTPDVRIETDAERAAQTAATLAECRKREILAITPRGLEAVADDCIVAGITVEEARKRLLDEQAKRCAPAGTPEPPPITPSDTSDTEERALADVTDRDLAQTLGLA